MGLGMLRSKEGNWCTQVSAVNCNDESLTKNDPAPPPHPDKASAVLWWESSLPATVLTHYQQQRIHPGIALPASCPPLLLFSQISETSVNCLLSGLRIVWLSSEALPCTSRLWQCAFSGDNRLLWNPLTKTCDLSSTAGVGRMV